MVVTDGEGRPVTGLAATDFAVEENGRPRHIESFEPIVVQLPVAPGVASQPLPTLAAVPRTHAPEEGRCVLFFLDDVHLVRDIGTSRLDSVLLTFEVPSARATP